MRGHASHSQCKQEQGDGSWEQPKRKRAFRPGRQTPQVSLQTSRISGSRFIECQHDEHAQEQEPGEHDPDTDEENWKQPAERDEDKLSDAPKERDPRT